MPTEEQTYRAGVIEKLDALKVGQDVIDQKVTYTNGKVRKIIIALVLIGGIVIGQAVTGSELIKLLAHLII